jgi:glycosyltransferase involved in cell wall biosynthesis
MHLITVCIPTIPPRTKLLERALASVHAQTFPAVAIEIATDYDKRGAAATRNAALFRAETDWVAFLDDDDELYPQHLERLVACQVETDADVVWPWFDVVGGDDPFPEFEHRDWDPLVPHSFPITTLVRRGWALNVGGFPPGPDPHNRVGAGEDWAFWKALDAAGARFAHLHERTWAWHHDSSNTGGLPSRW